MDVYLIVHKDTGQPAFQEFGSLEAAKEFFRVNRMKGIFRIQRIFRKYFS